MSHSSGKNRIKIKRNAKMKRFEQQALVEFVFELAAPYAGSTRAVAHRVARLNPEVIAFRSK
jgi:hypothetical protein